MGWLDSDIPVRSLRRLPLLWLVAVVALAAVLLPAVPRAQAGETPDPAIVARIQDEAFQRSQVMDTLSYLADVHGPRLTNSPQARAAIAWAQGRLRDWQLANVHTEAFPFGRGWFAERVSVRVVAPSPWTVTAIPVAWTPGTGTVTAEAVRVTLDTDADLAAWKGKLRGKAVLLEPAHTVTAFFEPQSTRRTDAELAELEAQTPLNPEGPRAYNNAPAAEWARTRERFLVQEGVAAAIEAGNGRGDHGSLVVQGNAARRAVDAPDTVPHLVFSTEHYGRIVRMLDRHVPVTLALDVETRFLQDRLEADNVIAEIPGTDRRDEVVMLGAHFDSWHGGTGATDNGAGSAVVMEAMRILRQLNLPLRRTVRLGLWTGEEQGLLGSTAYVRAHLGTREPLALRPDHERFSVYFNLDNGAGAIRGVFLQGNAEARPIFKAWMSPFAHWGMGTTTIRPTGSTDHVPFDAVGLPAFQFIQDRLEYFTISHHSSQDLYERVQPEDLKRNATILAVFAWQAATRDARMPRVPPPAPKGSGL